MKRQREPLMLFFTKLTSLPIDMISCVWKDWFEDFKSSKKGKTMFIKHFAKLGFFCLSLSATLCKPLEKLAGQIHNFRVA